MKKHVVWGILIVSFVLFSLAPMFYELSQKEKLSGRTFEPVHNYVTDYNFYLSRIREGMEGRWTVVERYTSEPHRGSFIQIFYLLLGKPASVFSNKIIGATMAYHTARVLCGLLFLFLVVRTVQRTFHPFLWQILGFLIVVTAGSIPIIVWLPESWPPGTDILRTLGGFRFGMYMSWWTVMDSLQRMTFLPHILFGQSLMVFLLGDLFDWNRRLYKYSLMVKFFSAFILGMVFPPGFLFVGATYGVMSVLEFLFEPRECLRSKPHRAVWFRDSLIPRISVISGGIPTLLYYSFMLTLVPWRRLIEFDVLNPTWFPLPEYGLAIGPVLLFGTIGALVSLIQKKKQMVVFVSWIIAWAVLLFVFTHIPQQSALRFTEVAVQVPLGILTVYLFYQIWCVSIIRSPCLAGLPARFIQRARAFPLLALSIGKIFSLTVPILLIVLGLGIMYCSYLWQKDFVNQKVAAGWPAVPMKNVMVYPITGFTDALAFIEKHTPEDAVILSDLTAGNYIPSHSGKTVFVGHDNTFAKEKKLLDTERFYKGEMNQGQAYAWLSQNRITYVFFGPQEREWGEDIAALYPFLREVYKNNDVTVYFIPAGLQ
ncbi:MAG: hypothetical protein UV63_C0035G0007 [Microgenomates group bacterium GW2011_GWC1_43_11]|uniref:Glycosyltransferase RgtA/B/C/D-like domain-containing protein n=2 Tax=Candidatus Gottesmaniibacteriota TaxID=1752720 RepID=A0A0G1IIU4_9BACT|nr:MAG: hypothetical protein UV09_C0040G0003 [Candidatus Gottesmanbacteria bacterium GW2011_GWA2_42_18]KKS88423.1 MAG: hypothetical protein UV63_C0035G0007 [Microgenomates group bacterium GW2011_GWC1_43_11]KKT59085.1 MAG: hypothetical protein UW52_C0049G0003 [Candidatus Gottesmanbacteria bacterium GW2011_GWA1_44_24b]HCM82676.1 hypothetical protein [Patescibacteria group bacterium]